MPPLHSDDSDGDIFSVGESWPSSDSDDDWLADDEGDPKRAAR